MSLVNVGYSAALTWGQPVDRHARRTGVGADVRRAPIELGHSNGRRQTCSPGCDSAPGIRTAVAPSGPSPPDPIRSRSRHVTQGAAPRSSDASIISASSSATIAITTSGPTPRSRPPAAANSSSSAQPLSCFRCHGGFAVFGRASTSTARREGGAPEFHNTGLYNLAGRLINIRRRIRHLRDHQAARRTSASSRRRRSGNIAVTAPLHARRQHRHAGRRARITTRPAVGRSPTARISGIGHDNLESKSDGTRCLTLTTDQRADLIAFLTTLTDDQVLTDPRSANPGNIEAGGSMAPSAHAIICLARSKRSTSATCSSPHHGQGGRPRHRIRDHASKRRGNGAQKGRSRHRCRQGDRGDAVEAGSDRGARAQA